MGAIASPTDFIHDPSGSTASSAAPAIDCRGLVKIYRDGVMAVRGLDLRVERGECFGLLGPNGAGKTTTIEILEGLLDASGGDVQVLGRRWSTDEAWLRERIGVSLQHTHLPEKLTVRELVTLFRSFFRAGRAVEEAIDVVALQEKANARFETLSGGQKQRLAVACALVGNPSLLFLDEPTTGLDPQSRRALWDVIAELKRSGGTVILTTHYMDEAERLCDRVAVVDHGKRIALGTPKELKRALGGDQIIEVETARAPLDESKMAELPGVRAVRTSPGTGGYALTVTELHESLPALLAFIEASGAALSKLSTHEATLEDVFVHLTGRQLRD